MHQSLVMTRIVSTSINRNNCPNKSANSQTMNKTKSCFAGSSSSLMVILGLIVFWGCSLDPSTEVEVVSSRISSDDAQTMANEALAQITTETHPDLELTLWASDSLVSAPVALAIDQSNGRAYYTMTDRRRSSEMDIRRHMAWATRSISFQHIEDHRAFLREELATKNSDRNDWIPDFNNDSLHDWRDLTVETEKIFWVEDQDEDGYGDYAQRYIADFKEEVSDVIGGVLPHGDHVFATVAPDVWRLIDNDKDGVADEKIAIAHGFGVHIGFGGHNLSGLILGPDGRIYWGIGDIGMHVKDQEGKNWKYPNQGVICRANPDGSGFEVFAAGLRNTHEFVFDDYGNIITEDNDGDHPGERERLMYVVDGHEAGWRINWQFGKYTDPKNNDYKVWMDEKLHIPHFEGQAAYIIPPIMNYVNGPTGMVHNPGTALGEQWKDHFFLVEFKGSPANAAIYAFQLKPKGAGFEFAGDKVVAKGILATGMDFGPDGALYFSDWIDGWEPTSRGRIWKLDVKENQKHPKRTETQALLTSSFDDKSIDELTALLQYEDRRVRMKAQFKLVNKEQAGLAALERVAKEGDHQLARIHALWGIEQLIRQDKAAPESLLPFLDDRDQEVVAQAAKLLGESKYKPAGAQLASLLKHESGRVQFFAAQSIGKIGYRKAFDDLVGLLTENNNQDLYLRHAATFALARLNDANALAQLSQHANLHVRLAAVVALRRMQSAKVVEFLSDNHEWVVMEAARAINDDWSIEAALPALAALLNTTSFQNEVIIRRAINANLRVGKEENLRALSTYAKRTDVPNGLRAEAIATIGTWSNPSPHDRVDGRFRGYQERSLEEPRLAFTQISESLLKQTNATIQAAAAAAIGELGITNSVATLNTLLKTNAAAEVREAAIKSLFQLNAPNLKDALTTALNDKDKMVRVAGLDIVPNLNLPPSEKVALYTNILASGTTAEQQSVVKSLGQSSSPEAQKVLGELIQQMENGQLNMGILLELEEAILEKDNPELTNAWQNYQNSLDQKDLTNQYLAALDGGNARRGRYFFNGSEAAQCTRCHVVEGQGSDVGPALAGVASRLSKRELLQSLVDPSAILAKGYGIATITLKDGTQKVGYWEAETTDQVTLKLQDQVITIPKSQIEKTEMAPSSMPPMGTLLEKSEIRDIVAYLGTLK